MLQVGVHDAHNQKQQGNADAASGITIFHLFIRGDKIFSMGFVLAVLEGLKGNKAWRNTEKRVSPMLTHQITEMQNSTWGKKELEGL